MAYINFDATVSGAEFTIEDGQGREVFVQTDWDYGPIASAIGWTPCECGSTDGTVDCKRCNRMVGDMLAEAYDYLRDHEGEEFPTLDDYLLSDD